MQGRLYFLIFWIILSPLAASAASFERDLYFGLRDNPEVAKLQEFLKKENLYDGPVTGGFFSLTKEGVKKFQAREGVEPLAGYFGAKTRARANVLLSPPASREELIASLTAQIAVLRAKLLELEQKLKTEVEAAPKPKAVAPEEPKVVLEKKLIIAGGKDLSFPETAMPSLRLGDIVLTNGTTEEIFLAQVQVKITDNMDSPLNRDKAVFFILRRGTSTADTEISRTKFTFNSQAPLTAPHTASLNFSLPETLKAGEGGTYGLWIDNLDYVVRGELNIEFVSISTATAVESMGSFKFRLTR